jgi:hypothetical protein
MLIARGDVHYQDFYVRSGPDPSRPCDENSVLGVASHRVAIALCAPVTWGIVQHVQRPRPLDRSPGCSCDWNARTLSLADSGAFSQLVASVIPAACVAMPANRVWRMVKPLAISALEAQSGVPAQRFVANATRVRRRGRGLLGRTA